jgi:integrase
MATIQRREGKNGVTYRVQVRLKGAPTQTATFTRKTDAKRWAQQTETAIREGRYFPTSEAKRRTAGEAIDRYIREHLPRKRSQVSPKQQLEWWRDQVGALPLAQLTPQVILETRNRLATEKVGKKQDRLRKPATVNRYVAALSRVLSVASREWGWCGDNPARKVSKLPEDRGRIRFLEDSERDALLDACRKSEHPVLYPLVITALATGARQGELLNLCWSDVSFDRKTLVFGETKNDEVRSVPIPAAVADQLGEMAQVRRIDDDRVFPITADELRYPWRKALKAAGITGFRFHDLRHSCASYLLQAGFPLGTVAEVLGHKTLEMAKRYSHLAESHTRAALEKVAGRIFGE